MTVNLFLTRRFIRKRPRTGTHRHVQPRPPPCRHPREGRGRRTPELRRRRVPRRVERPASPSANSPTCVRERKNGNFGYYNVNTHLNPTNVCVYRCNFCAFRADLKGDRAYVMIGRADPRAGAARPTTGLRPNCTSSAACTTSCRTTGTANVVRSIHERLSRDLHLKAYTAVEMGLVRRITDALTRELLAEHEETSAWAACPAAGPRSSIPRSASKICEYKADADDWLDVHREAHELGLRSNATMLYGHIETGRAPDRPPGPPPRAAGRDRRVPDLHPAGLPPGQQRGSARACQSPPA